MKTHLIFPSNSDQGQAAFKQFTPGKNAKSLSGKTPKGELMHSLNRMTSSRRRSAVTGLHLAPEW
jgi:hypothetical protein